MPLPSPLPQTLGNKSLLFHPRVAQEAHNLLGTRNVDLLSQLMHCISQTTPLDIDVRDAYTTNVNSKIELSKDAPELLRMMFESNPNVFDGVPVFVTQPVQLFNTGQASKHPVPLDYRQVMVSDSSISSTTMSNPSSPCASPPVEVPVQQPSMSTAEISASLVVPSNSHLSQRHANSSNQHLNYNEVVESTLQSHQEEYIAPEFQHVQSYRELAPAQDISVPQGRPPTMPDTTGTYIASKQLMSEAQDNAGILLDNTITEIGVIAPANIPAIGISLSTPLETISSTAFEIISSNVMGSSNVEFKSHLEIVPQRSIVSQSETIPQSEIIYYPQIIPQSKMLQPSENTPQTRTTSQFETQVLFETTSQLNIVQQSEITSQPKSAPLSEIKPQFEITPESKMVSTTTDTQIVFVDKSINRIPYKKQPIVKLHRLTKKNENLEQRRVRSSNETVINLGIMHNTLKETKCLKDDFDSEPSDESPKKSRKEKNDTKNANDGYNPNTLFVAPFKKKRNTWDDKLDAILIVKPKLRRVEKELVPVLEKLSSEELAEKNTYYKFLKTAELVIKSIDIDHFPEIADDGIVPDEHLLNRIIMQTFVVETAKLKSLGATEMIPTDKLLRILSVMDLNIRGGHRISLIIDEKNESIRQLWMETAMERVVGAVDACLVSLFIMTSPNMPKRVYLEDVIDRVVLFIKYQLHYTIFPSYDSTYKLDNRKIDGRRKKSKFSLERNIIFLYNKFLELIGLLAELLTFQALTDTSVLHASSMGVSPFFVENVSELQLACLKLVTTIFTQYESHRAILLDEILASIARLPNSKRSLRTYRLNSDEHIQMLTALILQLIQCVVALPENLGCEKTVENDNFRQMDKDVLISNRYDKAEKTAATFLTVFLSKCGSRNEYIDYRPLFENFVQDLLSTISKPEWPATELLLTLLGKMLVTNFSNKGTDMSLRVASLDYLGVVAARLRKNTIVSQAKVNVLINMLTEIQSEELQDTNTSEITKNRINIDTDEGQIQSLQHILLDFLGVDAQNNSGLRHARHFYIAQWYKDAMNEKLRLTDGNSKNYKICNEKNKQSGVHVDLDGSKIKGAIEQPSRESINQLNAEKYRVIEEKKTLLIEKIRPFKESGSQILVYQTYIDYSGAALISEYLASKRNLCQSFDHYLKAILIVLQESSIAIRTKALKCLTTIVESDASVLGRADMQMCVHRSFLDHATSVREAAVDLVGKFVLGQPELIDKYYEMLAARILDIGVSVRKKVIKILKDICIECPDFPKVAEICVKMIKRVNDVDSIRKLVMEVFQNMWFTPSRDASLLRKVINITDVVAAFNEIGFEWFEQLLLSLFKPKEYKDDSTKIATEPPKALLRACKQIVDCLIENILRLEETNNDNTGSLQRLVVCLTTLYLFAKIRPKLLVKHASTLQPYLSLKCQNSGEIQIIISVAKILELVVPLIEHPSQTFLSQLEEDSMKLVVNYDSAIVYSCVSFLGSVVNNVTQNFKLIRGCFKLYYDFLSSIKLRLSDNRDNIKQEILWKPYFRRAICVVGLLLRYFDFNDPHVLGELPVNTTNLVFELFSYFLHQEDCDTQSNALKAIGSICVRHSEFMLDNGLKTFYHKMLMDIEAPLTMKSGVLFNIELYLLEEDRRMMQQDKEFLNKFML